VEKNKAKLEAKIHSVFSLIDEHIEQDKSERSPNELPPIDSASLKEKVSLLNKFIGSMNKAEQKQVKQLHQD